MTDTEQDRAAGQAAQGGAGDRSDTTGARPAARKRGGSAGPPAPDDGLGLMANIVCETCCYWHKPETTRRSSFGFDSDRLPKGQCRRYPPVITPTDQGLRPMFPLTFPDAWCGEHGVVEQARQPADGEAA